MSNSPDNQNNQSDLLYKEWIKCMKGHVMLEDNDTHSIIFFIEDIFSIRRFIIFFQQTSVILEIKYERNCPQECRKIMAEFFNMVNYKLQIGFFIIHMDSGEIIFRHSVDLFDVKITEKFVSNFIKGACSISSRFYNSIHDICNGDAYEKAIEELYK